MTDAIEITGGADPEIAAAIAAVVDEVIRQELARDTGTTRQVGRSAWAQAGQFRERPVVHPAPHADGEAPAPPAAPG